MRDVALVCSYYSIFHFCHCKSGYGRCFCVCPDGSQSLLCGGQRQCNHSIKLELILFPSLMPEPCQPSRGETAHLSQPTHANQAAEYTVPCMRHSSQENLDSKENGGNSRFKRRDSHHVHASLSFPLSSSEYVPISQQDATRSNE